jgi:hypothetical protein
MRLPQRKACHMSPGVADKTFLGRIVWSVVVNLIVFLRSAAAGDDTCLMQAASNKLRGKELVSFMKNCKALMELICHDRAIDQSLIDEMKESFIKKCVKQSVGR